MELTMSDKPTLDWLRVQALTVIAELMTSDNDWIALRAARTALAVVREERCPEAHGENKEKRIVRYADRPGRGAPGASANPGERHPLSGGGLRAALGKDRSGEDRSA